MEEREQIKAINLVLDNPANKLTETSRDLLVTLRRSIALELDTDALEGEDFENNMCKEYKDSEAIPDEDGTCSLCGGDCI